MLQLGLQNVPVDTGVAVVGRILMIQDPVVRDNPRIGSATMVITLHDRVLHLLDLLGQ